MMKPTAEQLAVLDAAAGNTNVKVKAYAGAGKTATLDMIARSRSRHRGYYLAFNRDIAGSAKKEIPRERELPDGSLSGILLG